MTENNPTEKQENLCPCQKIKKVLKETDRPMTLYEIRKKTEEPYRLIHMLVRYMHHKGELDIYKKNYLFIRLTGDTHKPFEDVLEQVEQDGIKGYNRKDERNKIRKEIYKTNTDPY